MNFEGGGFLVMAQAHTGLYKLEGDGVCLVVGASLLGDDEGKLGAELRIHDAEKLFVQRLGDGG